MNKKQYHPWQLHKSGKSFNCPVFTFPNFTTITIYTYAMFPLIQQLINSEYHFLLLLLLLLCVFFFFLDKEFERKNNFPVSSYV